MIKKSLLLTAAALIIALSGGMVFVYAQEKTPTASPTAQLDDSIQSLKEKIADKVEELTQNNKKFAAGHVAKKEKEVIEIKKSDDSIIRALIDENVTQFYSLMSGSKKSATLEDFAKDDFIAAVGPLIDDVINANSIYKLQEYDVKTGTITDTDKNNYTLSVITTEKDEYTLDIEKNTKQLQMNPETLKIAPIGFSKLTQGDIIHFAVKKVPPEKNTRVSAIRLLIIPQAYFK